MDTFLLEDIWTFYTDMSWCKKLCFIDNDDSPLFEVFLDFATGLLVSILYFSFFWVPTEDFEILMKLLYFSATYFFHSSEFFWC